MIVLVVLIAPMLALNINSPCVAAVTSPALFIVPFVELLLLHIISLVSVIMVESV